MSSGSDDHLVRRAEHELARVQDERLVALRLDHPGQVGLVGRRVDVRVPVVLEDPEEPVEPDVDATTAAASPRPRARGRSARRRSRPGCRGRTAARAHPTAWPRRAPAAHGLDNARVTFHRYVALGDSFTEGVGDPDPTRPNGAARLGRPGRRGARPTRTDDFGYANLAIRGRKLPGDPRRAGRAGARARARPGHRLRRRQRHPAAAGRHRRARRARTTTRSAGSPRPAPGCWSSRRSTPAARRSTARCAAGSRSTTSWSARSPTGTARRSSTSGGCGSTATGAAGTPTGCTWARPATSGWRSRCSTPSASRTTSTPLPPGRPSVAGRAEQRRRRTLAWARAVRGPVGAPPAHRPLVRRRPRARAAPTARAARRSIAAPSARSGASCGCSSVGRARPSQGRCREFESRHPLRLRHASAQPVRLGRSREFESPGRCKPTAPQTRRGFEVRSGAYDPGC